MPPDVEKLWADYLRTEVDRIRSESEPALERFLTALLAQGPGVWKPWAWEVAERLADKGEDVILRLPLFRRVLLPALREGVLAKMPGCARWMVFLPIKERSSLPPGLRTDVELLREALRVDPADQRSRQRLLETWKWTLYHAQHELPDGVLVYGTKDVTPDDCDTLLRVLADFRREAALAEQPQQYSALIAKSDFYLNHYKAYLLSEPATGSFEAYLRRVTPIDDGAFPQIFP